MLTNHNVKGDAMKLTWLVDRSSAIRAGIDLPDHVMATGRVEVDMGGLDGWTEEERGVIADAIGDWGDTICRPVADTPVAPLGHPIRIPNPSVQGVRDAVQLVLTCRKNAVHCDQKACYEQVVGRLSRGAEGLATATALAAGSGPAADAAEVN